VIRHPKNRRILPSPAAGQEAAPHGRRRATRAVEGHAGRRPAPWLVLQRAAASVRNHLRDVPPWFTALVAAWSLLMPTLGWAVATA
jgi:hypothetical protein